VSVQISPNDEGDVGLHPVDEVLPPREDPLLHHVHAFRLHCFHHVRELAPKAPGSVLGRRVRLI
jgi:hypothetical protein